MWHAVWRIVRQTNEPRALARAVVVDGESEKGNEEPRALALILTHNWTQPTLRY